VAKVVCVLYPDPVEGSPRTYARDGVPDIARYPSGQTTPTPSSIDFDHVYEPIKLTPFVIRRSARKFKALKLEFPIDEM